jgi:ABC-type Na+ efflux pump permease subunit
LAGEDGGSGLLGDVRLVIARREMRSLSREKTIVLALLIQLFVAAFSSFLVVGLTSLYDPGSISTAQQIEVGVSGDQRAALEDAARQQDGVRAFAFETEAAALEAFQDNRVDVVFHGESVDGRIDVTATVPEGSIQTTVYVVTARDVLETLERSERLDRGADVVPRPRAATASPYFGFTYTILLPLLLFLPPFISGSVTVDALTEEMERDTLELLRVAPVTLTDIVDGKALGLAALAPIQAALWMALLYANGIRIQNVGWLLVLVGAIAVIVGVLGISLGIVMGRRRPAQLLYSVLALLLFGTAALLPEHPATTVARLAVGSDTVLTHLHVLGIATVAVGLYLGLRVLTGRVDPERL